MWKLTFLVNCVCTYIGLDHHNRINNSFLLTKRQWTVKWKEEKNYLSTHAVQKHLSVLCNWLINPLWFTRKFNNLYFSFDLSVMKIFFLKLHSLYIKCSCSALMIVLGLNDPTSSNEQNENAYYKYVNGGIEKLSKLFKITQPNSPELWFNHINLALESVPLINIIKCQFLFITFKFYSGFIHFVFSPLRPFGLR